MSGPRLALRGARHGHRVVDLLFYDDALAVVPAGIPPDSPVSWLLVLAVGSFVERRRRAREASPATLPRGTRVSPYASLGAVAVAPHGHGAATVTVDGRAYEVPPQSRYVPPWREALGPLLGDRLTVGPL